jgi:hypothetical protein
MVTCRNIPRYELVAAQQLLKVFHSEGSRYAGHKIFHFSTLSIPAPLLNLVEVALVGVERVVGFFVGPVVGHRRI